MNQPNTLLENIGFTKKYTLPLYVIFIILALSANHTHGAHNFGKPTLEIKKQQPSQDIPKKPDTSATSKANTNTSHNAKSDVHSQKNKPRIQSPLKTIGKTQQTSTKNTAEKKHISYSIPPTQEKQIVVENKITQSMLSYQHWTSADPYIPTTFEIALDGKTFTPGTTIHLPNDQRSVKISYYYEFVNGVRKGTGQKIIEIPKGTKKIDLTFNWNEEEHLLLSYS